jgi:hypothetical protein
LTLLLAHRVGRITSAIEGRAFTVRTVLNSLRSLSAISAVDIETRSLDPPKVDLGRGRSGNECPAARGEQSALSCHSQRIHDQGSERARIDPRHVSEPDIQGRLSCIEEGREFGVRPPAVAIENPIAEPPSRL